MTVIVSLMDSPGARVCMCVNRGSVDLGRD